MRNVFLKGVEINKTFCTQNIRLMLLSEYANDTACKYENVAAVKIFIWCYCHNFHLTLLSEYAIYAACQNLHHHLPGPTTFLVLWTTLYCGTVCNMQGLPSQGKSNGRLSKGQIKPSKYLNYSKFSKYFNCWPLHCTAVFISIFPWLTVKTPPQNTYKGSDQDK